MLPDAHEAAALTHCLHSISSCPFPPFLAGAVNHGVYYLQASSARQSYSAQARCTGVSSQSCLLTCDAAALVHELRVPPAHDIIRLLAQASHSFQSPALRSMWRVRHRQRSRPRRTPLPSGPAATGPRWAPLRASRGLRRLPHTAAAWFMPGQRSRMVCTQQPMAQPLPRSSRRQRLQMAVLTLETVHRRSPQPRRLRTAAQRC